ncbi:hypothetical protein BH23GEM6_BH23GEM6_25570 [soil metagenome]
MSRRLVSIRREIMDEALTSYDSAWAALEQRVTASGAHAWRFVSAAYPMRYLEFLEFAADADPRGESGVADALAAIGRIAPGTVEEWDETA